MLLRIYENISYAAAGLFLLILTFLTLIDVVGRNVFNSPLAGATELTEYALVGLTFLVYPVITLRRQHIVVDLFDSFVGRVAHVIQQLLAGGLGALVFGVLSWRLWKQAERVIEYGDVTPYLRLPVAPAYYFMAVLSGLTVIAFVVVAFGLVKQELTHEEKLIESE